MNEFSLSIWLEKGFFKKNVPMTIPIQKGLISNHSVGLSFRLEGGIIPSIQWDMSFCHLWQDHVSPGNEMELYPYF